LDSGVKAKQQKKTPAGKDLLFSGVLFSLSVMVKAKSTKKETLWPAHGLARNFATKLPPNNSLEKYRLSLVQLKTVKGDLLMELSLVEFFHPAFAGVTLTH
jgi:hypothetical protein